MKIHPSLSMGMIVAITLGIGFALFSDSEVIGIPVAEVCDFIDNDLDGEIDEGFAITCQVDADCGESGPYGEAFCSDGNVYTPWYQVDCVGEIGTCGSKCRSTQIEHLLESCSDGCRSGKCIKIQE